MSGTIQSFLLTSCLASLLGQSTVIEKERAAAALLQMRSAKTIYFDDQTRINTHVGEKARSELKKWKRYKIVDDRTQADLILLLSLWRYEGGYEVHPGGQTGAQNIHGQSQEALAPSYLPNGPSTVAYLTAIDPETGQALWSKSHPWGGLLTGFDSVGGRLVKKLKKDVK